MNPWACGAAWGQPTQQQEEALGPAGTDDDEEARRLRGRLTSVLSALAREGVPKPERLAALRRVQRRPAWKRLGEDELLQVVKENVAANRG